MTVFVLDHYYLLVTLLVTVGYQLLGFFIAWTLQFDKITDFTGGSNFFIVALVTLLFGNTFYTRNIVATIFQLVWALRIAGFLLFRVLKTGSDNRFDEIRGHFWKFAGFWVGQILWVWLVSLPVIILNSPAISRASPNPNPAFGTAGDIVGIILWVTGWLIESIADAQKYRWKSATPKPRKDAIIQQGLWRFSRHPPYFGEILCWWGIWALCLAPSTNGSIPSHAKSAQYASIISPLFTMILLIFGSGLPPSEKPTAKKYYLLAFGPRSSNTNSEHGDEYEGAWRAYKEYRARTSVLVLMPQGVWKRLPGFIKVLLGELPMFKFDEGTDGSKAVEEAKRKAGDV